MNTHRVQNGLLCTGSRGDERGHPAHAWSSRKAKLEIDFFEWSSHQLSDGGSLFRRNDQGGGLQVLDQPSSPFAHALFSLGSFISSVRASSGPVVGPLTRCTSNLQRSSSMLRYAQICSDMLRYAQICPASHLIPNQRHPLQRVP
jgi:hypothetical protein